MLASRGSSDDIPDDCYDQSSVRQYQSAVRYLLINRGALLEIQNKASDY